MSGKPKQIFSKIKNKIQVESKPIGIDPYVSKKAISKHKDILSEQILISAVLNATGDQITPLDSFHFIVSLRRKTDRKFVTVLIWVHDQGWRYYIYGAHVSRKV